MSRTCWKADDPICRKGCAGNAPCEYALSETEPPSATEPQKILEEPLAWLIEKDGERPRATTSAAAAGEYQEDGYTVTDLYGRIAIPVTPRPEEKTIADGLAHLADGLENCIESAKQRRDEYDVGYMGAMLKMVNELREPYMNNGAGNYTTDPQQGYGGGGPAPHGLEPQRGPVK